MLARFLWLLCTWLLYTRLLWALDGHMLCTPTTTAVRPWWTERMDEAIHVLLHDLLADTLKDHFFLTFLGNPFLGVEA